jgi:hypothetical protein
MSGQGLATLLSSNPAGRQLLAHRRWISLAARDDVWQSVQPVWALGWRDADGEGLLAGLPQCLRWIDLRRPREWPR